MTRHDDPPHRPHGPNAAAVGAGPHPRQSSRMLRAGFIWVVAGIAVFVISALSPPILPAWAFRHLPAATLAVSLGLTIYVIWRRPGAWHVTPARAGVFFAAIMLLFGLSIGTLWGHALTTGWVNLGLFPTNDAEDFLRTAHQILTQGGFETPRGRPLANSVLATLLIATGFSLKVVVAIFTAAAGLACWMAAISVWRSHGLGAGLVMFATLFAFAHGILGSVASEPVGFILGTAAFAVLWDAVTRRSAAGFRSGADRLVDRHVGQGRGASAFAGTVALGVPCLH